MLVKLLWVLPGWAVPGWATSVEGSESLPTNHSDSSGHLLLMRLKEDRKRSLSPLVNVCCWILHGLLRALVPAKMWVCRSCEQTALSKREGPAQKQRLLLKNEGFRLDRLSDRLVFTLLCRNLQLGAFSPLPAVSYSVGDHLLAECTCREAKPLTPPAF